MIRIALVGGALLFLSSAQAADLPENLPPLEELDSLAKAEANPAMATFNACQDAIESWAEPFQPLQVTTIISGPVQRHLSGKRVAPLFVTVVYDSDAGPETRKASVECTVDAGDEVAVRELP